MSQAKIAAACGVSRQAIHKKVASGQLPMVDGKIDLEVARAIFAATLDPAKSKILRNAHEAEIILKPAAPLPPAGATAVPPPGTPPSEPLTNYHLAKTLRENYEARRSKLQFEQEVGTLVLKEDVLAAASALAMIIGAGLDMLPGRIGSMIANEADPVKREQMVESECRLLREDFAKRALELMQFKKPE